MRRVVVIGTSGAGKSTLAAELAAILGVPHIELDALHWEPNWVEVSTVALRERVATVVIQEGWVIDGNYAVVRDLVWSRADIVIWLDYPLRVLLWRLLRRSWRRVVYQESCCNGNRESVRLTFSRDSVVLWMLRTYRVWRRQYAELLPKFRDQGGEVIILRTPSATRRWLTTLACEIKDQAAARAVPPAARPRGLVG